MYIPIAPQTIEVMAPIQNANEVYMPEALSTHTKIMHARMRTTTAQIVYYALMNSAAP